MMPLTTTNIGFALLDEIECGIVVLDRDLRVRHWNSWMERVSGLPAEDLSGRPLWEELPALRNSLFQTAVEDAIAYGVPGVLSHTLHPMLFPLRCQDGRPMSHDVNVRRMDLDGGTGVLIQVWDVTERCHARNALIRMVDQQKLQLQELNHRVTNNFQIMCNLLERQQRKSSDPDLQNDLAAMMARVRSMALVHRQLYQSGAAIQDMASYLEGLCRELRSAFFARNELRTLVLDADAGAEVPTDISVVLGMIVAELVLNAYKYAYAPDQAGSIKIRFRRHADGCELVVSDQGRGLPDNIDPAASRSFGMSMIRSQVARLRGTLHVGRAAPGTTFTARFPFGASAPETFRSVVS
ncbi:sensor histidine kinase [Indioceanicola profundi]|uniref:sensor histidine kinase n=1 Tax=Indioceanicola profundi TaxID=2220096 RepID=UPI000E6A9DA3|nr:histidine kinase dimerization/phosphoacceptor domain -containing protein [Indioceanicola profundi]